MENTSAGIFKDSKIWDHLHIRGEYEEKIMEQADKSGSPPHTWRIRCYGECSTVFIRITSTYVENTGNCYSFMICYGDHLHIRGEYPTNPEYNVIAIGSPPHTWRILKDIRPNFHKLRITSTYVENTCGIYPKMEAFGDHLHIRGEYSKQIPL